MRPKGVASALSLLFVASVGQFPYFAGDIKPVSGLKPKDLALPKLERVAAGISGSEESRGHRHLTFLYRKSGSARPLIDLFSDKFGGSSNADGKFWRVMRTLDDRVQTLVITEVETQVPLQERTVTSTSFVVVEAPLMSGKLPESWPRSGVDQPPIATPPAVCPALDKVRPSRLMRAATPAAFSVQYFASYDLTLERRKAISREVGAMKRFSTNGNRLYPVNKRDPITYMDWSGDTLNLSWVVTTLPKRPKR